MESRASAKSAPSELHEKRTQFAQQPQHPQYTKRTQQTQNESRQHIALTNQSIEAKQITKYKITGAICDRETDRIPAESGNDVQSKKCTTRAQEGIGEDGDIKTVVDNNNNGEGNGSRVLVRDKAISGGNNTVGRTKDSTDFRISSAKGVLRNVAAVKSEPWTIDVHPGTSQRRLDNASNARASHDTVYRRDNVRRGVDDKSSGLFADGTHHATGASGRRVSDSSPAVEVATSSAGIDLRPRFAGQRAARPSPRPLRDAESAHPESSCDEEMWRPW